jgi:DNA (cytosine-5)-methyltransferase 1
MKLMSLFDGSGGFPLAASLCGIEPVYAAEVEPYPIAVTKNRFPKMKHLGDVSKVKGGEIEPVDIITFGSPCQDMSIAGKRAGLKHADMGDDETTRSGLFLEAIRIIKEMREATNGVYPRYAIWENVPGAFSSNRGEDFRTVLDELIKISEPDAVMPAVPQAGWAYADCISGDGWSIAYRVFDAQYWGVPQRRRRIYLVADFRGECAQEILFKRESLRGYFEAGRMPWQGIAADAQNCVGTAIGGVDRYNQSFLPGLAQTLRTPGGGDCTPTVLAPVGKEKTVAVPVHYIVRRLTPTECARLQGFPDLWGYLDKKESFTDEEYKFWSEVRKTYGKIMGKPVKEFSKEKTLSWYNKLHSDSAEYKMWGNGISLPVALYVLSGIAEYTQEEQENETNEIKQ